MPLGSLTHQEGGSSRRRPQTAQRRSFPGPYAALITALSALALPRLLIACAARISDAASLSPIAAPQATPLAIAADSSPTNAALSTAQAAFVTPSPSSPLSAPVVPTPTTPPACLSQPGQIIVTELLDAALPRSLPYRIYLPPCYGRAGAAGYPTLYLLHGLERTDSQWDDLRADEVAGEMITGGDAPPFLLVMPWERKGLDFEAAVVDYLIPAVEREYSARPERSARAIAGISRGAGWALRIALNHPQVFAAAGLHSPAVLPPDLFTLPGLLESLAPSDLPALWIDIGDRDPLRASAEQLTALLDEAAVTYTWRLYPGRHTEAYWAAHMQVYLRWQVARWGAAAGDG